LGVFDLLKNKETRMLNLEEPTYLEEIASTRILELLSNMT
jgi:hypothetical protein